MEINKRIKNSLIRNLICNDNVDHKLTRNNYSNKKRYNFSDGKKVNEKSIKISNEIYSKGLKLMKKKEKKLEEKILTEEIEFDKISFKPDLTKKIQRNTSNDYINNLILNNNNNNNNISLKFSNSNNHSQNFNLSQISERSKNEKNLLMSNKKSLKSQESNDLLKNNNNNNYQNYYSNSTTSINLNNRERESKSQNQLKYFNKKIHKNLGMYERSLKWKESKENKTRKLRDDTMLEENKSYNFSPNLSISKYINIKTDDRFYKSEIKHIESYIKRRKETLFKEENKKDYENKIFYKNKRILY